MDNAEAANFALKHVGPIVRGSGGPLGLVGRAIGMGPEEIRAGVPGWAWLGIGVLAGGVATYLLRDRFEAFLER